MQWQYRAILFELTRDGLLGDKYVDDEAMEKTLNQMGGQGWELINVILLQDGVLAFLKKPAGQDRTFERPVIASSSTPMTSVSAPSAIRPRHAVAASRVFEIAPESFPESEIETQSVRLTGRQRTSGMRDDDQDSVGGIKIS
jgi:hypothetical protein